jgi:Xaa-Pro aminopeptidase
MLAVQITQWYDSYYSRFRRKYNDRQKAVYNAVLRVKNEATKMLPGTLWKQYHIEVGKLMTSELLGLGPARQSWRANKTQTSLLKYFMHGTSHHMGPPMITVLTEPMQANMVFTVELEFISCWRFRNTLGDDLVIQESGEPFNLMQHSYWSGWNWKFDELAPRGLW